MLWVGVSGLLGTAAAQTKPARAPDLSSSEMHGTVGGHVIGLNYTVRNRTELTAAHYFYASNEKDIPLTGAVTAQAVELKGADGSVFHLHFIGNGSEGKAPLTFYNSIGLSGTWVRGPQTLPVRLTGGYSTANPGQGFYADVTSASDGEFEAMVRNALAAIVSGDQAVAGKYIHLPLRVSTLRGPILLHSLPGVDAQWARIFPPALIEKLRGTIPHEMFVRNGQAMLGDGELWFDGKGLRAVNTFEAGR